MKIEIPEAEILVNRIAAALAALKRGGIEL
jgi:hypothetical protein